jgi:uncharacterized protein
MLKELLKEFLTIDGVTTAALIGRDGFVIEIADTVQSDIDALGALCSGAMSVFEKGGTSMGMGTPRQVVLEHREGSLILMPVSGEEFLAVLTNTPEGVGRLTWLLAKTNLRVAAII